MKCKMKKFDSPALLALGLALMTLGIALAIILDAEGLAARLTGFATGMGGALVGVWLFVRLRRRLMNPEKYEDAEREMSDERGQLVNSKAFAVQGMTAVGCIVAMTLVSVWRGDHLFMALGTASCFVVTVAGIVARAWFNKRL